MVMQEKTGAASAGIWFSHKAMLSAEDDD